MFNSNHNDKMMFKLISATLIGAVMVSFCLPVNAFAYRSRSGGAKMAEPDFSGAITGAAISIAATAVTVGIGSAWGSASSAAQSISSTQKVGTLGTTVTNSAGTVSKAQTIASTTKELFSNSEHFATGIKTALSLKNALPIITKGYSAYVLSSSTGGAVASYGVYKGWKPSKIYLVSTIASAALNSAFSADTALGVPEIGAPTSSLAVPINPSTLPSMAKGAFVGTIEGAAKGFTVYAIDRNRIDKGKGPSVLGQVAGFTTGMMGAGFARELMAPAPTTTASYQEDPDKANTYYKIEEWSKNDTQPTRIDADNPMSRQQIQAGLNKDQYSNTELNPRYKTKDNGGGILQVIDRTPTPHLFRASVVQTLDNWPIIATKAAGIAATQNLGKKAYLEPLISGTIDTVLGSALQNTADIYGLKPSMYMGGKEYVIANRINYNDTVRTAGYEHGMKSKTVKIAEIQDKYKGATTPEELGRMRTEISQLYPELQGALNKMDLGELARGEINDSNLNDMYKAANPMEYERLSSSGRLQDQLTIFKDQLVHSSTPSEMLGNIAISQQGIMMQAAMKGKPIDSEGKSLGGGSAVNISINDSLRAAGTSKSGLFMSRTLSGMRSGMLDTLISGGTQALFTKSTRNTSAGGRVALSFAGNMLSATIRGVAFHNNWQSDGGLWFPEFESKNLEQPKLELDSQGKPTTESLIAAQYYQANINSDNYRKLDIENNSGSSHDTEVLKTAIVYNPQGGYETVLKRDLDPETNAPLATRILLESENTKPTMSEAIGFSVARANMQSLVNTWSFGIPAHPENTTVAGYVNYLDGLQSKSELGLNKAVTQSFVNANLRATSGNIVDSFATSKRMADAFGLTPIRLVHMRSSPLQPLAVQRLYYNTALFNANTQFEYPLGVDSALSGGLARAQNPDGVGKIFKYKTAEELKNIPKLGENTMLDATANTKQLLLEYAQAVKSGSANEDYTIVDVKQMFKVPDQADLGKNVALPKVAVEVDLGPNGTAFVEVPLDESVKREGLAGKTVNEAIIKALGERIIPHTGSQANDGLAVPSNDVSTHPASKLTDNAKKDITKIWGNYKVVSGGHYGDARGSKIHDGEDLAGFPVGTKIPAFKELTVVRTGRDDVTGNYIVLKDAQAGKEFGLGHLDATPNLAAGQVIEPGQSVGQIGMTGVTTGPHIHLWMSDKSNPRPYLNQIKTDMN